VVNLVFDLGQFPLGFFVAGILCQPRRQFMGTLTAGG